MAHRLLLADDSVTIQRVIELTFADEDVQVVAVSDGDAAIARLGSEPFDIVLADVGMPKRGGYDIAEFVRTTPALSAIPVMLLAGAFEPVDDARVKAVGAAAVLVKPFEPQMVIARVRELLATRRETPGGEVAREAAGPRADALPAAPPPPPAGTGTVDDYFARLDQAFAGLNPSLEPRGTGNASLPAPEPAPPAPTAAEPPRPPAELEIFNPSTEWQELALPSGSDDGPSADAAPPRPEASVPHTLERERPAASPAPADGSSALVETFSTLLAVERGELPASAVAPPGGLELTDELIDRIARRVAERLGEGAVRDLAADIVSRTAERLVREEIERIKSWQPGS